jgi:hypothetical protein
MAIIFLEGGREGVEEFAAVGGVQWWLLRCVALLASVQEEKRTGPEVQKKKPTVPLSLLFRFWRRPLTVESGYGAILR